MLSANANCSSCHADKTTGKSVHSAMEAPCTTCHLVQTEDSKTVIKLAMAKEEICFACHEKATIMRQHWPEVKESCTSCHDSHSSNYRMLLSAKADAQYQASSAGSRAAGNNKGEKFGAKSKQRSSAVKASGSQ